MIGTNLNLYFFLLIFNFLIHFPVIVFNASFNQAIPYVTAYDDVRTKIMDVEMSKIVGSELWLTAKEEKVNDILMNAKKQEITEDIKNPHLYPPTMHFFKAKPLIRQSEVFRIIQKMPKGALLHGHNTGMVSSKWIIQNLTHQFNVNTCKNENGVLLFTFRNNSKCTTSFSNICIERLNSEDKRQYDRQIEKHINMYTMKPEITYMETQKLWKRFENIFETVDDFYKYLPVFRAYHRRLLEELYEDNIFYAEMRISLSSIYDDDDKEYTPIEIVEELEYIIEKFKREHPDFIGMKLIYAKRNRATNEEMLKRMTVFKDLFERKPNIVIGFDLIGHEDSGEPLHRYLNELSEFPNEANFFFHAGETNWYGKTDWNLLDAILLNTKRIGHGYALYKHPNLWKTVKERDIAIEINPISNQILGLIWNLKNHPATFYVSENLPIVISSDDPGLWNSKGLSYDFYYAFMCFTPIEADLKVLKQFVLNSIKYAVLTNQERRDANNIFKQKWERFLDDIIESRY